MASSRERAIASAGFGHSGLDGLFYDVNLICLQGTVALRDAAHSYCLSWDEVVRAGSGALDRAC